MHYRIGDLFIEQGGGIYILAMVGYDDFAFIGLETGNRFEEPVAIPKSDIYGLTEEDLNAITNGCFSQFTYIDPLTKVSIKKPEKEFWYHAGRKAEVE